MGRTRVKDMPRSQQKAVFAKMTGDGYSQRLESAEKYHRRADFLRKKHDLAEETEDKIMDVWADKKLTYRQKMGKITKIRSEAGRKLITHEIAETAPTIVGKMREEKWKRFKKQAHLTSITEVPEGHDRQVFDATVATRKMRSDALFSHEGLLLTQAEYVEGLKNRGRKLPKGSTATTMPGGMRKRVFDSHVFHAKPKAGSYIKVNGLLVKQSVYQKALRRNARVRYPHMYSEEKKKSSLTYRQLKKRGVKLNPKSDSDKDGVPNAKDCRPLDKTQQHPKGSYLAFAEKKNEQLRAGTISTEQYKKDMAVFRKKQRGGLPVGIITRSKVKSGIAHSKELDKRIREMSKLGLSKERICRKYGIEPKRVDAALGHPKNLTYRQLKKKGYRLDPKHDSDKDGVPNAKDCRPLDKTKQHGGRRMKKGMAETVIGNIAYARSPEGRKKAAQRRIREIETKRRAEALEIKAKQMEQQYKQEHPSAFTRLRKNIAARRKKKSIYA